MCYHAPLVPDYGVLPRSFGIEYRECSPYVFCYHISLVPDLCVLPR